MDNIKIGYWMKHLLRILIVGSILITSASCIKEYTCQCKITFSGQPGLPAPEIREYTVTNTLKAADQECKDRSKVYSQSGITTTEACELY